MSRLSDFLDKHDALIRVRISGARGSSPREAGAEMLVSGSGFFGTIGGGQLEFMAIDRARVMLRSGQDAASMDVPLGPEIGQCCGGRIMLSLDRVTEPMRAALCKADAARLAALPEVYILGAGHVGRALAALFEHMPVRAALIDSRAEEMALSGAGIEKRLSPLPESEIRTARPGSAFIVLTHDHALDFLLASEALARGDAAYVGLIGSATKRARFERFCAEHAPKADPASLVCPIGSATSGDKRPEVIAALTLAEVMAALAAPDLPPTMRTGARYPTTGAKRHT